MVSQFFIRVDDPLAIGLGPMFLNQEGGHINLAYVVEDGPLKTEVMQEHPYFPGQWHYVCANRIPICVVVVYGSVAPFVFQDQEKTGAITPHLR